MAVETYKELRDAYNSGKSFVLCTVIDVKGSSPAKAGQCYSLSSPSKNLKKKLEILLYYDFFMSDRQA